MFEELPQKVQDIIRHYLERRDFIAAKAIYDGWNEGYLDIEAAATVLEDSYDDDADDYSVYASPDITLNESTENNYRSDTPYDHCEDVSGEVSGDAMTNGTEVEVQETYSEAESCSTIEAGSCLTIDDEAENSQQQSIPTSSVIYDAVNNTRIYQFGVKKKIVVEAEDFAVA